MNFTKKEPADFTASSSKYLINMRFIYCATICIALLAAQVAWPSQYFDSLTPYKPHR